MGGGGGIAEVNSYRLFQPPNCGKLGLSDGKGSHSSPQTSAAIGASHAGSKDGRCNSRNSLITTTPQSSRASLGGVRYNLDGSKANLCGAKTSLGGSRASLCDSWS